MNQITSFKREWLKDYKVIERPMQKVELEVTSNVSEKHRINSTDPTKSDKYIVNLKAIPVDQYDKLVELLKDNSEVPIEKTNGMFLTGTIWVNGEEKPYLPMKGEALLCNIDYVENREKEQVLRVTNVQAQPAQTAPAFDFAGAFEEEATGTELEVSTARGARR